MSAIQNNLLYNKEFMKCIANGPIKKTYHSVFKVSIPYKNYKTF